MWSPATHNLYSPVTVFPQRIDQLGAGAGGLGEDVAQPGNALAGRASKAIALRPLSGPHDGPIYG